MSGERVIVCGSREELLAVRYLFPAAHAVDGRRPEDLAGLRPSVWLIMPGFWAPTYRHSVWVEACDRMILSGAKMYEVQPDLSLREVSP